MIKRITIFTSILFIFSLTGLANAASIDFSNMGTYQTNQIITQELSITGSDTLNLLQLNGLGVDSGIGYSNALEGTEWVAFSFLDNYVTNVILNLQIWGNGGDVYQDTWFTLSSFDAQGVLLGTYSAIDSESFTFNVNELTGADILSSFTILMDQDITRIRSISYQVVPVPAAVWLFVTGLLSLGVFSRRQLKGIVTAGNH